MAIVKSRYADFIPPILFLAVSATVFWQTNTDLVLKKISSGNMQYNAAFVPEILATLIVILAAIQVCRIIKTSDQTPSLEVIEDTPPERAPGIRALASVVIMVAYVLILKPLGYHIATPLLLAGLFVLLNVKNLLVIFGCSIFISVLTSYVFGRLLNVVLPAGMFEISPF